MTNYLKAHEGNTSSWFDAQYNLRAGRPDYEETVIPNWIKDSKKTRENLQIHRYLNLR